MPATTEFAFHMFPIFTCVPPTITIEWNFYMLFSHGDNALPIVTIISKIFEHEEKLIDSTHAHVNVSLFIP